MEKLTVSHHDHSGASSERPSPSRPADSGILKGTGAFDDTTVSREQYTAARGERYETKRPVDSDLLRGDGTMRMETQNREDYRDVQGDRCEVKRPVTSDVWAVSKTIFCLHLCWIHQLNVYRFQAKDIIGYRGKCHCISSCRSRSLKVV
jgi:hypothetical protein